MFKKLITSLFVFFLFQIVFGQEVPLLKCLQCDSATDANCIIDLSKIESKECNKTAEYCLTSVGEKGNVIRSCSEKDCASTDKCKSSKDAGGNKHNICQTCSSSSDAKCAQSETVQLLFNNVCAKEDTKCLVTIKDKHTERRCASDEDETACKDINICKACTEGNCNSGLFPPKRLRCFQCDASNSKCSSVITNSDDIKSIACQLYDSTDKCYMFATDAAQVTRGCVSDSKDNKCSVPGSNALCSTCESDNCNNKNYKYNQSLKCIQCISSTNDEKCKWGHIATEAKDCQKEIVYNQEEMCYTQKKDDVVQRGCFYDREGDQGTCENDANCEKCKKTDGDGCNNKDKADHTCIVCRSDENTDCVDNADKLTGKGCRNAVEYDKRECFRGKWNDVVIRGCLVDADERVDALCRLNNTAQCENCLGKDCNKMKTSAAQSLGIFSTLILLGIVFLVQKF